MAEVIHNLVTDTRRRRFSSIPKLSEEEIVGVWDLVAEYIEFQMCSQRGVHIPSLGTFTFSHKKLGIGNNKFLLIQRPVFLLSEKFAQTHALKYTKHHTTGEIPVVHLNFTAVAVESRFDRDTVETCVREVLQSLSRAISNQKKVEFLFRGIGVLSVKAGKVKMKFFKDFIHAMDGSGNLIKLMENRPGTADSVMSTQTTLSAQQRPGTCTITLPKLNGSREASMPAIAEHATGEGDKGKISLPPSRNSNRGLHSPTIVGVGFSNDERREKTPAEELVLGGKKSATSPADLSPKPPGSSSSPQKPSLKRSSDVDYYIAPENPENSSNGSSGTDAASRQSPESAAKAGKSIQFVKNDFANCLSPKHHHKSGHDLCYLCMQRAMRNIPVSFQEERRRKEIEQDALLQQYQQMKDHEAILIDKANLNASRHANQKVAAFNFGVAECVREAKKARSTDFVKSYVFQNRPLTPPRFYKQDEYSKALENQVKLRITREEREKRDREFQERLEQVQLAEDLAAQREQFLRVKADQVSQYQNALSAQLRSKAVPLPKAQPDSEEPIFGRNDATNEKLLEQKERSKTLLKSQLDMVSEKKKKLIIRQLTKQKEENDMLHKTKKELLADRIGAHKRAHDMRCELEKNWRQHHRSKIDREVAEKERLKTPGMLLLQQTEKYKRCDQCERTHLNCGESNIWSESRYVPGSRLMV